MRAGAAVSSGTPFKFFVTHDEDGTARLVYHRPSKALAVYGVATLASVGRETDRVMAEIARRAAR